MVKKKILSKENKKRRRRICCRRMRDKGTSSKLLYLKSEGVVIMSIRKGRSY